MRPAGTELTSIRSPRVKAARQLGKRALRQRARAFLAEGPQAVGEALAAGDVVSQLFITATAQARYGDLGSRAAAQGAEVHPVSGEVMAELAQTVTPQGVLAVCRFIDVPLAAVTGSLAGEGGCAEGVSPPGQRSRGVPGGRPPGKPAPGGGPGQRPRPGQRRHGAAYRRRRRRGRGPLRRLLGRPVQQQMRPRVRGQPVPSAGGDRHAGGRGGPGAARGRAARAGRRRQRPPDSG